MKLPEKEIELMQIIWQLEKPFMKDILVAYPEPKPAATTIATLLKRLQDKQIVGYNEFGNSRQYFAILKKDNYFSLHINGLIKNHFNDSTAQFASFFTTETNLSQKELLELRKIIDKQIKTENQ
ncbi:MAG: hypothetical protein RLZZ312_623 [Bacteroidota bacterium]|jgi:predicted transcriptional regulator